MSSVSRLVGGVARPRDLRVVSGSRGGHFDRIKLDQPPVMDTPLSEGVSSSFRETESLQALQASLGDSGEGADATQCEHVALCHPSPPNSAGVHRSGSVQPRDTASHISASPIARSPPQFSPGLQQSRVFHTSSRVPYESTSYNLTDVPDFFIRYKECRAASSIDSKSHEHEELGLMPSLSDSILAGDVVASTRRLEAKIPVEHHAAGGHVVHPSGFVVPGPGHISTSDVARAKESVRNEMRDRAVQTAAVARHVRESGSERVNATTVPPLHKVPFEVREPDGMVRHPSGFVPPTPAHKFKHPVGRVRQPSPPRAVLRAMHTTSSPRASGDA